MYTNELNSALHLFVTQRYQQIVRVNLSIHICKVIWSSDPSDDLKSTFHVDKLWNSSKLYPNDVKVLRKLHNVEFVKKNLSEKSSFCYKFRQRKVGKAVEWMQIEVVKGEYYADDNVDLLMFVKNIEDSYGKEYKAKKEAERLARTDVLTGFHNRLAFNTLHDMSKYNSIGVVYIDLNQLKDVNDTKGHTAGDVYIKQCCTKMSEAFSNYKKYRVGGDEFVIIALNSTFLEFNKRVASFTESVNNDNLSMPMCSLGYKWTSNSNVSIDKIVKDAEHDMYLNKEANYLKYHADRRHTS